MNTRELSRQFPEAFAALPKCYQADDVLYFWYSSLGTVYSADVLHARPSQGQEKVLGEWEAVFVKGRWESDK